MKKKIILILLAIVILIMPIISLSETKPQQLINNNEIKIYDETEADKYVEENLSNDEKTKTDLIFTYRENNSWFTNNLNYTNYSLVIKNNSNNEKVCTWNLRIKLKENTSVESYWNCDITKNNNVLEISPKDYNSTIYENGSTEIGIIMKNNSKDMILSYELYGENEEEIISGEVNNNDESNEKNNKENTENNEESSNKDRYNIS